MMRSEAAPARRRERRRRPSPGGRRAVQAAWAIGIGVVLIVTVSRLLAWGAVLVLAGRWLVGLVIPLD